jgi:hypothetical protein
MSPALPGADEFAALIMRLVNASVVSAPALGTIFDHRRSLGRGEHASPVDISSQPTATTATSAPQVRYMRLKLCLSPGNERKQVMNAENFDKIAAKF